MAHFAQLNDDNVVLQVVVISNEDITDKNGIESEEIGIAFCKKNFGVNTKWRQTSYNNNFRVRYAGIGYSYNQELDAFVKPQPFSSWILNSSTFDWESPLQKPELSQEELETGMIYEWDENLYNSDNTKGWILINR